MAEELLAEQQTLTAVERFARWHEGVDATTRNRRYRGLIPLTPPAPGQQYAFEVDLDQCSGCKACVTACHALNGLDDEETWRSVGLLVTTGKSEIRNPKPDGNPKSESRNADFDLRASFGLRPSAFGIQQQHVTTACHHCADPGCLSGCPVLAYDKDPVTGIVRHLDDQCIGCQYCVMKCPYEVPKYSERLGIVRKCDMCANRLAGGEPPACVQACPNEAIRITLVDKAKVRGAYRSLPSLAHASKGEGEKLGGGEKEKRGKGADSPPLLFSFSPRPLFLPDSPNPAITLPTTRYLTRRAASTPLQAADRGELRLEPAHWPLVVMLVLTQAAAGLFIAGAILQLTGTTAGLAPLLVTGKAALLIGLVAAVFHLGRPMKAWRAFLGWRTSWLSREIIAFNVFAVAASAAVAAQFLEPLARVALPLGVTVAFAGALAVFASAMVYVDTRRPIWCARITFGNFFGTTLLLGATFAAALFAGRGSLAIAQPFAIAALLIRTALFVWRRLELRTALHNSQSPIHFNARIIQGMLPETVVKRTGLFVASTVFGLLAIADIAGATAWWAGAAALATVSSEIIGRQVYFAAGAAKRMPGGVAA
jgi:formate dehydrogenase iron-sulfur subunit